MRIFMYSDVHWCAYSSVVRSRGNKYSSRLENLIRSVNWAEQCAVNCKADTVVCLGDFFDSSSLTSEEITALQEIRWAPISHVFITGNHEASVQDLSFSTTEVFKLCPSLTVISKPEKYQISEDTEICFLPYVTESDRKTLIEYFGQPVGKRYIFSHNDLKDVSYGAFVSKEGFSVEDIKSNCLRFFNGHIHSAACVTDNIFDVGNLTGQNFSEDARKYEHVAAFLDTETNVVSVYENPEAYNFSKYDLSATDTIEDIQKAKNHSIITVKVKKEDKDTVCSKLDNFTNIEFYRCVVALESSSSEIIEETHSFNIDHITQFSDFVKTNIGTSDVVLYELQQVIGG